MRIDTARRTLIVGVLSALTLVANSALTPLGVIAEDLTIENTEKTNNLELDKLQKKFEELLGQENYNEALAVVKILQDKQIKTFGENHKTVASTYLDIGFLYFKKGLVEKSISALKNSRQILKSSLGSEYNQVTFKVDNSSTKKEIKIAVEKIFKVKVKKVNTSNVKGKLKSFRGSLGKRSNYKKAFVTLEEGQTIDINAGV